MSRTGGVTSEDILSPHPPQIQEIAERLRSLITSAVPDVIEKAYTGWHGIGYMHPKAGYFCCIFPSDTVVKLAFEYGALLPDPDGLLVLPPTSSKQVRYVELRHEHDIREQELVAMLYAAIQLKF